MFCIFYGFGTGFVYKTALFHAWLFFPGREGLVSGTMLSGFGCGGLISTLMSSYFINPTGVDPIESSDIETKPFTKEIAGNLPYMFEQITNWFIIVILVSMILVEEGPIPDPETDYLVNHIQDKND